jgi:hypothetical protein
LSISGLMRENVFKKSEVQYIIKLNFLCVIKVTSFVNFISNFPKYHGIVVCEFNS